MKTISFFDTKPYDKVYFDAYKAKYHIDIIYHETKLNKGSAILAKNSQGVCAFVNDTLDRETLETLCESGIEIVAMRCAGYNNVDLKFAKGKIHIVRVPAYSPHAVAEATMGMLLTLNRKFHRAYNRTREYNFSINGLNGFDLYGKTIGVVGTGQIGRIFIKICKGFGMNILAYDPYPAQDADFQYVDFNELCEKSDIISLHCPLTKESHYIINQKSIEKMKQGVYIINTSRGALIDSDDLLENIKSGKIGGAALDVYEEESDFFFEDLSNTIVHDDVLSRLISMPNVLVTSHQAFFTNEAIENIAKTTLGNFQEFFDVGTLTNEVCYK
ncbi:2-hydroxyacid dehydrogenase [Anaeromicropila populeti]|uniref:D-lactate dehydrogenase n=1 Tax=Anaeromicropila populeti TaxID=37658 RepID=A0A1I6INQ1_9FIRM|nr:2-hydroxyacid dehydrogenase [Anaeromicropila populeti]SFR68354.1 D-lactate dehydrogenase [Anaeromicropila populeti]